MLINRRFFPLAALGSMLAPKAFAQPLTPPGLPIGGGTVSGPSTFSSGISFGSTNAASTSDLSKHIALFGANFGINVTASTTMNFMSGFGTTPCLTLSSANVAIFAGNARINGNVGFYNTAPVAKQTVSGAKGSNAALGSLMTALVAIGLLTDSTTA